MRRVERLADDIASERYGSARALFVRRGVRPPFLLWQPHESDLPSPILVRILRWWLQLPRYDSLPVTEAFDPAALGAAADHIMVVDVIGDGHDFHYTHFGAALARAGGHSMRGQRTSTIGGHVSVFLAAVYRAVIQRREPIYTEHEPPHNLFVAQSDRLILPLLDRDGRIGRMVVALVPEAPLRTLIDTVMDGVVVFDHAGMIRMANAAGVDLFGCDEEAMRGRPVWDFLLAEFISSGLNSGEGIVTAAREAVARRLDGHEYPVEVSIGTTRRGRQSAFLAVVRDISARKAAEEHYRALAFTDALTGLANRFVFQDRLAQALARARRTGDRLALFMMDLDSFKAINDTYGHLAGDRALKEFAKRVRSMVRETDILARLGGDEFALVQTDLSEKDGALKLAGRLLATLAEPLVIDGCTLSLNASLGIAIYPADGLSIQALMEHADQALYDAKSQGGSRYAVFQSVAA